MSEIMDNEKPLSEYILDSQKIEINDYENKIKLAFLSSFTINGLAESLKVKCSQKQISCSTYIAGYNQYNQEILDEKSELYIFLPDITFLILDTRSIFGDLFHFPYSITKLERKNFVDEKINELLNLVEKFNEISSSKLIITNLGLPHYSPHGIAEMNTSYSFHDAIIDFNKKLKDKVIEMNSVHVFDFFKFVVKHGENNVFNFQNYLFGDIKIAFDYIPHLANELIPYVISFLGLTKKCIVVDLDNTLWGGIVGEDGFDGIRLGPQPPGNAFMEFQKYLKALSQRGIILAINSKNNFDDAIQVIREHPHMILKENDFACMKINWNDKVSNMQSISEELNIGLDSFVFFDDDPVNREFVKKNMPEITTPDLPHDPSRYSEVIQSLHDFSVFQVTNEDINRGKMYFQQKQRSESKKSSTNLTEFLKTLNLEIDIKKSDSFTIPRISQLTMKTNQFNLTTKRYHEEELKKFSEDDKMLVGCAQIRDKFGDNGITGVFIVEKTNSDEWFLDTFLLSCRVMGREIEKAILYHIINEARKNNVKKLKAKFIPTAKNKPIEHLLSDSKFSKENNFWVYNIETPFNMPEFLTLRVK
jgi:FkbH-like protein